MLDSKQVIANLRKMYVGDVADIQLSDFNQTISNAIELIETANKPVMKTRWEIIQEGGLSECAKAMAFVVVQHVNQAHGLDPNCNAQFIARSIMPHFEDWLNERVKADE